MLSPVTPPQTPTSPQRRARRELVRYEDSYWLRYVWGPGGIINRAGGSDWLGTTGAFSETVANGP
jgi:hypothetical protein